MFMLVQGSVRFTSWSAPFYFIFRSDKKKWFYIFINTFFLIHKKKCKPPDRKYNDLSTSKKEHSKWRLLKVNVT